MEKERNAFLESNDFLFKMFIEQFSGEFNISDKNKNVVKEFEHTICVVYNKYELIEFLNMDKNKAQVLVCLFNEKVQESLSFLQEVENLISVDRLKTTDEISKDLRLYFKRDSEVLSQNSEITIHNMVSMRFNQFYKALFFLN